MGTTIGLMVGNFVYQWLFGHQDWLEAAKLSFFQGLAIWVHYLWSIIR